MAIRGQLDELQASEVLQFLTQSGRSGTLCFRSGRRSKYLAFEAGRLVFAVSQSALPPLAEVLHQRGNLGVASRDQSLEHPFDAELTKALEWSRSGVFAAVTGAFQRTRLGRILIARGCISQEELDGATNPRTMVESELEDLLVESGVISSTRLLDVRKAKDAESTLFAALVETDTLTESRITEAIGCMPEETLARILIDRGLVSSNEVAFCLEQLAALSRESRPHFRIGEYLVVTGKLAERQLEKALGAQVSRSEMIGEILVQEGVLTAEDIDDARREIADLRLEFSPLRVLREALAREHSLTRARFAEAIEEHLRSEETLASILVKTGRVAEADLRKKFEDGLAMELSDLMLWREGSYEFFEGFSLADALGDEALTRIHGYSFEVSALLLDAHYRVDEMRRTILRNLGPATILVGASHDGERTRVFDGVGDQDLRLMDRMDGTRSLEDVCSVLPGNFLSHAKRISEYVDEGLAALVLRRDAFDLGKEAFAERDFAQALVYFEHAVSAAGDDPAAAELRLWAEHARLARSRNVFRRGTHALRRGFLYLGTLGFVERTREWCGRHEAIARPGRWLGVVWHGLRTRWIQASRRTALTIQDFLIQKGVARQWWTLRRHVVRPLAGWGGRPAPKIVTAVVAVSMVVLALMIPGVTTLESGNGPNKTAESPLRALRDPSHSLELEAPIECAPAFADSDLFVTTRDGNLQALARPRGAMKWQVKLGKFGDLLSSPTLFHEMVYVTNVRGSVHAVSRGGERLWTKLFPRVERIAPIVIAESRTQAAGIVVVARESVFVLHPEDGRILYRLKCGNLIEARPVVEGDKLFVGSADNHVYCANWRTRQVLWDTEVLQDVLSLHRVDQVLLARIRGGAIVAVRAASGEVAWKRTGDARRVHAVHVLAEGEVALEMEDGGAEICDATTGKQIRAMRPVDSAAPARLLVAPNSAIYYTERGDIGQVNHRGERIWRCKSPLRHITSVTRDGDNLFVTSIEGNVWIFSLREMGPVEGESDE